MTSPSDSEASLARVADRRVANVLFSVPSMAPTEAECCVDLTTLDDPSRVVVVTFDQSPAQWLATYHEHAQVIPRQIRLLAVGGARGRVSETDISRFRSADVTVETIHDPTRLTHFGTRIRDHLEATVGSDDDATAVFCFRSISALVEHTDLTSTYKFLHALTALVGDLEFLGHYHLYPAGHDDRTIAKLNPLFDGMVRVSANGVERSVVLR